MTRVTEMETEPRLPEKRRRRATGQEAVQAPAPLSVRQLQVAPPPAVSAAPATATHSGEREAASRRSRTGVVQQWVNG